MRPRHGMKTRVKWFRMCGLVRVDVNVILSGAKSKWCYARDMPLLDLIFLLRG